MLFILQISSVQLSSAEENRVVYNVNDQSAPIVVLLILWFQKCPCLSELERDVYDLYDTSMFCLMFVLFLLECGLPLSLSTWPTLLNSKSTQPIPHGSMFSILQIQYFGTWTCASCIYPTLF